MTAFLLWLQHHWIVPVFGVFLLILAKTYWPGRKARLQRYARIPLDDDR